MKKRVSILSGIVLVCILMVVCVLSFDMEKEDLSGNNIIDENLNPDVSSMVVDPTQYVAVDDLGRTVLTNNEVGAKKDKYVGMFYWLWHTSHKYSKNVNVNELSEKYPDAMNDWDNPLWSEIDNPGYYHWNEPLYGYYTDRDEYVLRRHAELLADAGVDFVLFDCTNDTGAITYNDDYMKLFDVWLEAKKDGVNVPKIGFMLHFVYCDYTIQALNHLYNNVYSQSKYQDLWFYWEGKPLIMSAYSTEIPSEIRNFFTIKRSVASYFDGNNSDSYWGWLHKYPQALYTNSNGSVEMTTVGVAMNADYKNNTLAAMNGKNIMGRSYASGNYSYSYNYRGNNITVNSSIANSKNYGINFQQQWDYAISKDPEIIFVTGWNEWIMDRFESWGGTENAFPDQYNDEYSRDIEPTKGDLKDYYYYQLVSNIRKFKGANAITSGKAEKTINLNGDLSQWNDSNIITYNHYTGLTNRDAEGWNGLRYTNTTARNDIKTTKVSYDDTNIYFYVETVNNLTSYTDSKWMRLLIDTQVATSDSKDYEEFEYIVNRDGATSTKLKLERSIGGWSFETVGMVDYKVVNNVLQIVIPRNMIGQTTSSINFNYKWCDNNLDNGDIMTIYTNGDSAPGGRFAFPVRATSAYNTNLVKAISLNQTSVSLKVGNTITLQATITPSDASNKTLTWSSNDSSVATVDNNGIVTALKEGNTQIVVSSSNGVQATCNVTVSVDPVLVTSVKINSVNTNLKVGDTLTLTADILPANATNKAIIWESSDASVATVSSTGLVTALKSGNVTITATTVSENKKDSINLVIVVPVTGVNLDKENYVMEYGDYLKLNASILPVDATNKNVTWHSSNENIATVSNDGYVQAIGSGEVTITVKTLDGNFEDNCVISINEKFNEVTIKSKEKLDKTILEQIEVSILKNDEVIKTATLQNGLVNFYNLDTGTYNVKITKLPKKYFNNTGVLSITVDENKKISMNELVFDINKTVNVPFTNLDLPTIMIISSIILAMVGTSILVYIRKEKLKYTNE